MLTCSSTTAGLASDQTLEIACSPSPLPCFEHHCPIIILSLLYHPSVALFKRHGLLARARLAKVLSSAAGIPDHGHTRSWTADHAKHAKAGRRNSCLNEPSYFPSSSPHTTTVACRADFYSQRRLYGVCPDGLHSRGVDLSQSQCLPWSPCISPVPSPCVVLPSLWLVRQSNSPGSMRPNKA